jgi:hypothetical protein
MHHPFVLVRVAWLGSVEALGALGTITIRLDAGSVLLGLAPVIAVVVNYYLSKQQRLAIAKESTAKVAEVHTLVNSAKDQQDAKIAHQDERIVQLERLLATEKESRRE